MRYRFEKLNDSNLNDLLPIYEDAFKQKVDIFFLRKKQDTSVFGLSYVGFIAYSDDNEPAAFYGVFPCIAVYQDKKYLIAQSGDTMTHSNHTGRGLFTQLAKITYDYCKENGVHLVFGFPNKNSYPGFVRKLDWIHFDDMDAYIIRVKTISWYRIHKHLKISDGFFYKRGEKILQRYSSKKAFKSSCQLKDVPVVDHSNDFFQYKTYGDNYLIEVEGVGVWLKFDTDFLMIGDIEKVNDEQLIGVVKELKKIARKMFIPALRFHGSKDIWLTDFFRKKGESLEVTYPIGGINFTNIIPLEKMKFTMADNDTF